MLESAQPFQQQAQRVVYSSWWSCGDCGGVAVTVPSTGRADIKVLMRSSKTEILPFIFSIWLLLLVSPACSIIGDEADGRTDVLT